jgi:hypothetical protein
MERKTMTLNLNRTEMNVIETLCAKKGLNKTALLRQCLRLYQTIEDRIARGEKMFFEDDKKQKSELVML